MIMSHIGHRVCCKHGAKDRRNVACQETTTQMRFTGALAHSLKHTCFLQLCVYCLLHILPCKPGERVGSVATFQQFVILGKIEQLMANQVYNNHSSGTSVVKELGSPAATYAWCMHTVLRVLPVSIWSRAGFRQTSANSH